MPDQTPEKTASPRPSLDSRVRRLEPTYFLLWARPQGEEVAFEVSKEVNGPLQPRCPTSPYCPGERIPRVRGRAQSDPAHPEGIRIASVVEYERNPNFPGVVDCPYAFRTKDECYRDINVKAMTRALFGAGEIRIVQNFLVALGYEVEVEAIPGSDIDGTRILKMHGQIYNFHETRFEPGPGQIVLCMIRSTVDA